MTKTFFTADLYDEFGDVCSSCETQFQQYGGCQTFSGRIRTVKCRNDNSMVRRVLETRSEGEVLVIDGAADLSTALMGDMIAELGSENGWNGIIILGAVRDVRALARIDIGVKALGSNPRKSAKRNQGELDVTVSFGGTDFRPGEWLYSDDDGILVSPQPLLPEQSAVCNEHVEMPSLL